MDKRELFTIINTFYKSYGSLPELSYLQSQTKLKKKELLKLIKCLNNKTIFDFYFHKGNKDKYYEISTFFLKTLALFIGMFTLVSSISLSFMWFHTFFNIFISIIISLTIVGSNFIFFNLSFGKIKKEKSPFYFKLIWFAALFISIITIMAGQLNIQMEKDDRYFKTYNLNENKVDLLSSYKAQIENKTIDKKVYQEKVFYYSKLFNSMTSENKDYWPVYHNVKNNQEKLNTVDNELSNLNSKYEDLLKSDVEKNKKEKKSFFKWLADIFNLNEAWVQFFIFILPAILLDLTGPICLSLFLRGSFDKG